MMSETDEKMSIDHSDSDNKMSDASVASKKSEAKHMKELCGFMEFYFSDSNLSKDRLLKHEIESSSDGCKHIYLVFNR